MGTGTNVQQRLVALHHLDCPWRPMDLEQQEGRIIRQGNTNKEVQIYTYVTEGTFDSNMYAQLARKQRAISQFYSTDMTQRSCEDISDSVLSYLDVAAITSGNPLIKEQAELQRVVTKLQRQRTTFYNEKYALQDRVELEYPEKISRLERVIPMIEEDLATAQANPKTEEFCGMTIKEKFYDSRKDAGTPLNITSMYRTPTKATTAAAPSRYGRWMNDTSRRSLKGSPTGLARWERLGLPMC